MVIQRREEPAAPAPLVLSKPYYEPPNIPKRIQQLSFDVMPPGEMVQVSELHVSQARLFKMPDRKPHPDGPLDPRLGVSSKQAVCSTCGQKLQDCTGHFGHVKLALPVFHIGYHKDTIQLLQCICKTCSRVLLQEDDQRTRLRKATGVLKIIHEKYSKNVAEFNRYMEEFSDAVEQNDQIQPYLSKIADDLNPLRALSLFKAVRDQDCELLDLGSRPENLIMTHVPVPPVCIRPSVEMDTGAGSNEDDITMKLMQIIETNNVVRKALEEGLPISTLMENWDFLQNQCAMEINSDMPGVRRDPSEASVHIRGLVQRLKGKGGRFRGNLSGKRVDFSGRTVISPDPNLSVEEVCIPQLVAMTLTYPERVTEHNIDSLRQCVMNGMTTWPGANFLDFREKGRWFLKFGDRRRMATDLKIGDVVERHLQDGDIVLFNRQPSLHRMSIMAHRARVQPWRTFRFNESVCSPYNADFDGDEMNLHVPQTEEARAEAIHLMGVMNNLCTPKNGEILIAATQDFLTSAFLLTSKDKTYTRAQFSQLCSYMGDGKDHIDLPTPAFLKPLELWTGKQLFSILLRPNARTRIFVNLETKEKNYCGRGKHMCPRDGWVCFYNSELVSGRLGKATLGGGNKAGLFQVLNADYSPKAAAQCMNRLAKLSARFIGERGFSIGIDDVTPAPVLAADKLTMINQGYATAEDFIDQFEQGTLELQPGCNMEQSLEALVTGVLNDIRQKAGNLCMDTLHWHNSPLIMSQCGSKGSPINIAQMVACVGQQSVGGKRAPNGFKDRSLPHFPRGDKTPAGKGFVGNSFYSGLTPLEFFFHTMGGREGLVDTAVKTAETGYMSRRLMKALEDFHLHYDSTVRSAANAIVQLKYGDDGLDPVMMEGKDCEPIDLARALSVVKACTAPGEGPEGQVPHPSILEQLLEQQLEAAGFCKRPEQTQEQLEAAGLSEKEIIKKQQQQEEDRYDFGSQAFCVSLRNFLLGQVAALQQKRLQLGLPEHQAGNALLELAAGRTSGLTPHRLKAFLSLCRQRYELKGGEPGATVGAVGSQSIGEPGTQMTLKTFHFAGVASMNVTLGVPRLKEIINAAKSISTPIMTVKLAGDGSQAAARLVKARLERSQLGQVCKHIKAVLQPGHAHVAVRLDMRLISKLSLDVTAMDVKCKILEHSKLKLKDVNAVRVIEHDLLEVDPPVVADNRKVLLHAVAALLQELPLVTVQGLPTVQRAVVKSESEDKARWELGVEGTDLRAVMAMLGVNGEQSVTNSVAEIEKYLGIEAARKVIIQEVVKVMSAYGIQIDHRHTMLLADCMTFKGDVLGITRFGISKMKDSVLALASFEKSTDHLFDAALHGRVDDVTGVSESIIMGAPMPTGTGIFKIQQDAEFNIPAPRSAPFLSS
ncbi:hypothetical protein WJX84_010418 [Apatococcus fuscideae]|uniref:DNA-directed RNA polymerase subunit n=1 Tax=Apatococcus fuscideae TaxID=2026836 RepID=A0AAW1T8S5_9CHLO